jgi:hypothetical protein
MGRVTIGRLCAGCNKHGAALCPELPPGWFWTTTDGAPAWRGPTFTVCSTECEQLLRARAEHPVTVVAAAIRFNRVVHSVPPPGRHHHVILKMRDEGIVKPQEQGFVLSDGRFADRHVAAAAALQSKQITKLSWPTSLYSEDLW